jgi:uncharacterized membrane protein YfcA
VGPIEIAMTLAATVVIGGLIGSVGIGGVLLVPWLTAVIGLGVRDAVAIAMASYIATGIVAIVQARFADNWTRLWSYWPLVLATLPGAFLGGLAIAAIPERIALAVLALFLIATGAWALLRDRLGARSEPAGHPDWPTGMAGGFASALTGTGGPAVLTPILMWRGVPLLAAIALGQIVQLPIAAAATVGNLLAGPFDVGIAALVAAGLTPGVVLGRWTAKRLPVLLLARIVAALLIATGVLLVVRALR